MSEAAKTPFDVFASIQDRGIRLIVVGGYAVNALGYTRVTNDVDCLIVMDDLREADRIFKEGGYTLFSTEQTNARYFNPDTIPGLVDVLLVNASTFEKMWSAKVPMRVREHQFHVPRLEDLFAMKLHATRNQAGRKKKDLLDISELLKANPGVVPRERMAELCNQFGPPGKVEELLTFIYGDEDE